MRPVWTCRISSDLTWELLGSPTTTLTSKQCDAVVCCPSSPSQSALPTSPTLILPRGTSPVGPDAESGRSVFRLLIIEGLLWFNLVFSVPVWSWYLVLLWWVTYSWGLRAEARLVVQNSALWAFAGRTLAFEHFHWDPWCWRHAWQLSSAAWFGVSVRFRLAGFAAAGDVCWLGDGWAIASFAGFVRRVRRLFFLLLFLLLLLLLLWLLVFDMCNFQGGGLIEKFVQGVESAAGWRQWSSFVLERVGEACQGNIVENFFVLL